MASDKLPRHVDILSFDGGGSRGIMEVLILSDVMRLATIVWRDPEKLSYLTENNANLTPEIRKMLVHDLDKVSNPFHPTQIYDMIVGTSTGALIAFALVGGKENKLNGKRLPMTLKECIDMYLKKTKKIFEKSWSHWFISRFPGFGGTPMTTYSQDNVKTVLVDQFGESRLVDFKKPNSVTSVAGAVARQIGQKEELVLFDTSNEAYKYYKTNQVLLASSNAPVYFDTPVRIGGLEFVDGGVGGNCPLAQAIPRAKEIFPEHKITSALSIATPIPKESHIPRYFQIGYWLNYFANQSTDGCAVYKDAERRYKSDINFQRLSPRGESLKDFKLDSDAEDMLRAIEDEKLSNDMFLVDVIATASVVVDTYVGKAKESPNVTAAAVKRGAQLAQLAGDIYVDHSEYESACNAYNTSKRLWKKLLNEDTKIVIAEIDDNIAKCFEKLGKYWEAIRLYRQSIDNWKEYSNKSDDPKIAKALRNLAQCLLHIYDYDKAQEKFQLALEMQKRKHGQKANADVASIFDNLGWCQWQQGNIAKAIIFYESSLKMKKELYPTADHLQIAETMNNIGICLTGLGKHDEAIKQVQDAFDMRMRHLMQTQQEHTAKNGKLGKIFFLILRTNFLIQNLFSYFNIFFLFQDQGS